MRSYSVIALLILLGRLLVMTPSAQAQKTAEVSASQSATTEDLPNWLSVDLELRSRTEEQSAINFLSGISPVYDLTRLRIGVGVESFKIFFSLSANAGCTRSGIAGALRRIEHARHF